jgi:carbon-monoxide dehydrogenase medium subunit
VYPPQFEYLCPDDLESALELLQEHGEEAKVLAGGQSLIPMMKLRFAGPRFLIDINHVAELKGFEVRDDAVVFGALCRYAEIEESSEIAENLPILKDAAAVTADVQVRNRGTIGGSLVHSDPAGDWAPPLLALDARATVRGPKGERSMSVEELFQDAYTPDLRPNELLIRITVSLKNPATTGAYLKFEKRAGDFATASVGAQLRLDEEGRCQDVRVALGALATTAVRARETETILTGRQPTQAVIEKATRAIQDAIDPFEDVRGSVAYKRHLAEVVFDKALSTALARAKGEEVRVPHL